MKKIIVVRRYPLCGNLDESFAVWGFWQTYQKNTSLDVTFSTTSSATYRQIVLLKQDKYGKIYKKLVAFDLDGPSSKFQKEGTFCAVVKMES